MPVTVATPTNTTVTVTLVGEEIVSEADRITTVTSTVSPQSVAITSPIVFVDQFTKDFGAIGDGLSHPLSERYATLAAAKTDYPFITSLSQQIDWAALQKAINTTSYIELDATIYYMGSDELVYPTLRQVKISGQGKENTFLFWATDAGSGKFAIRPDDLNADILIQPFVLEDVSLKGPMPSSIYTFNGFLALMSTTSPVNMDGIQGQARIHLQRVNVMGFRGGFLPVWDHWTTIDCNFINNWAGRIWDHDANYGQDAVMIQSNSAGNLFTSDLVTGRGHIDHCVFIKCHFGFAPYGIYKQAVIAGGTIRRSTIVAASNFENCSFELCGNGIVYDENQGTSQLAYFANNDMSGTYANIDTTGTYRLPGTPAPTESWRVKVLKANKFEMRVGNGGPFDKGSASWILSDWIDANEFEGDLLIAAVAGAYSGAIPFLKWGNVSLPFVNNSWCSGNKKGKFKFLNTLYGAITKHHFILSGGNGSSGVESVLADPGNRNVFGLHYLTGAAGVALTNVSNFFDVCMVQTEGICDVESSTNANPLSGDYWAVQDGANPGKVKGLQADTAISEGNIIGIISGTSGAGLPLWTINLDLTAGKRWPLFVVNSGAGAPISTTPIEMPYVDITNNRIYIYSSGTGWIYVSTSGRIVNADISKTAAISKSKINSLNQITGAVAETYGRDRPNSNTAYLLTGRESVTRIIIPPQQVINAITFACASTPLSAGTHQWATLRNSSYTLLTKSYDDTSNAWGGSFIKRFIFSRTVTDAVATSGSNIITSATANFTSADLNKEIIFVGAGTAGGTLGQAYTQDLTTTPTTQVTISFVDSPTQIRVSSNAGTSVASSGTLYIGTPYTTTNTDDGIFYVGLMVAGTVPTMAGIIPTVPVIDQIAPLMMTVDVTHTGLTTPATAPNTLTPGVSGALGMGMVWAYLS